MPYQLGQYVGAHNRRMRARTLAVPVAAAVQAGGQLIQGAYNMLPSMSEQRLVNSVVRAAHELKCLDYDVSTTQAFSLTSTPTFFLLNGMQQGATATTRTGRQVKSEGLRLVVSGYANAVVPADNFRFLVVLDKECRGAQFTTTDLLQYNTQGYDQTNSPINFDNTHRFQILMDKVIVNNCQAAIAGPVWGASNFRHEVNLKFGSKIHYYNTSSGTVTDLDSGAIILVVYGANSANAGQFQFSSRFFYRDL